MRISMIAAIDRNRLIGKDNDLPWSMPEDHAYFYRVTRGYTVIMGRKNMESLNAPLKGRRNIVMTRQPGFHREGCETARSLEEACLLIQDDPKEVFIIGGEDIYRMFLPYASQLYLTEIDHEFEGDVHFPEFDRNEWKIVSEQIGEVNADNPYPHIYYIYERIGEPAPVPLTEE